MGRVIDYQIVKANARMSPATEATLRQQVLALVQQGYEPIGGVSFLQWVDEYGLNYEIFQAMILRE